MITTGNHIIFIVYVYCIVKGSHIIIVTDLRMMDELQNIF